MNKSKQEHAIIIVPITTTPAMKRLACLISKKAGSCKRNSVETGIGHSVSHGYNHALLIAAEYYKLVDLTAFNSWYKQYKSKI